MSRSVPYYLNHIHTLFELVLRRATPTNVPVYCLHEPTSGCNLKCPACPTGVGVANVKETAELADYEAVCAEFGQYLDIYYLFNWGEPTMAKSLPAIIQRLRSEPFEVHMSTNFSVPLKDEVIAALAGMPNLDLRINIDGATQDSHQKYRVNSKLSIIVDNCERLANAIKASPTPPKKVYVGFLAFDYNAAEYPAVKELATRFGFKSHKFDNPLVAGEPLPVGNLDVQQAFGCTWLYSSISPTPKLSHVAPCCGVWDGAMMSPHIAGRSLHETFMHEALYMQRRTVDAAFAALPVETRVAHLTKNLAEEEGMALGQKDSKVDACVGCTMGKSYQNKLTFLVNNATQSYADLFKIDHAKAQARIFGVLEKLVPGQESDPGLRNRLYRILDMPAAGVRSREHYTLFSQFLAAL